MTDLESLTAAIIKLQEKIAIPNRQFIADTEIWRIGDIALYFKRTISTTLPLTAIPSFPAAIQISEKAPLEARANRCWLSTEVISWTKLYQGKNRKR